MHYNFTDIWNCTIISTDTLYTSRLPYFGNIIIILYSEKDKKISIRGRNRSVQNAVKFLSSWISLLSHIIIHSGSWNIAKVLWIVIGYIFCKKEYYYELAKLKMVSLLSNSCSLMEGGWNIFCLFKIVLHFVPQLKSTEYLSRTEENVSKYKMSY